MARGRGVAAILLRRAQNGVTLEEASSAASALLFGRGFRIVGFGMISAIAFCIRQISFLVRANLGAFLDLFLATCRINEPSLGSVESFGSFRVSLAVVRL
jgi:hypothetical protein